MLLGDIGVGKSSIVQRLVFDRFEASYKPTIGVDIYRYQVPLADGDAMPLLVWDTDGNFGDAIFRHVYMRKASAAIVVCDVTRAETLNTATRLAETFCDEMPGRPAVLLKNKCDLIDNQSAALGPYQSCVPVFLTSALSGENVMEAFLATAEEIRLRHL